MTILDHLHLDATKDEPRQLLEFVELDIFSLERDIAGGVKSEEALRNAIALAHLTILRDVLRASMSGNPVRFVFCG